MARSLHADAWTAEVVTALRTANIRTVLLKGPVIARWLYAESAGSRTYRDVDLLVSSGQEQAAAAVLVGLGFEPFPPGGRLDQMHARTWVRRRDGAEVDLHTTVHQLEEADPSAVWEAFTAGTEWLRVAGVDVEAPSVAARLLHVVCGVMPLPNPATRACQELDRAIVYADPEAWNEAAALAGRLSVAADFGARLHQTALSSPDHSSTDRAPEHIVKRLQPKQPYQRPRLMRYGSVVAVTRGLAGGSVSDLVLLMKTMATLL